MQPAYATSAAACPGPRTRSPWTANAAFGNAGNLELRTDSDAAMPQTVMDIARARQWLGWTPAHDLDAGLRAMAAAQSGEGEAR